MLLGLILIGLIAMGTSLLLRASSQKVFTERRQADRTYAKIIAEAGAHKAVAMIKADPSLISQPIADSTISGGTSSVVITTNSSSGTSEYLLTSVGTYHEEEVEVALVVQHAGGSASTEPDPVVLELFDGALFCGGDTKMVGGSWIDMAGATAHVNGKIVMTGSAQFRDGTLVSSSTSIKLSGYPEIFSNVAVPTAPSIPWGSPSTFIHGTIAIGPVPEQMIEIDLEPFRTYALAGDIPGQNYKHTAWNEVYTDPYISADEMPSNGKLTIGGCQTVNPVGGVLWVEGSIKFAGSSTIKACVIATGNVDVLGGMTHANPGGLPAFMSVNGRMHVGSGCKAYGLIYAHNGDILIDGDATVEGAFICPRGNFDNRGSGKIEYDNSRPYGPNGEIVMLPLPEAGEVGGSPEVSAWVK